MGAAHGEQPWRRVLPSAERPRAPAGERESGVCAVLFKLSRSLLEVLVAVGGLVSWDLKLLIRGHGARKG